MKPLRIGALFAGYGGLDMAVMDVLNAELAWYAEFDKGPASVMAHHHPDVPNLWDVTTVDWAAVEPVDIITGGSPCQDLSHAGKRKGMTDGTRSNLWAEMREAIAVHRPRLVVWENVRGALSAVADSDMEQCPRCVGGAHERGPVLRALGRVLGDLAELGYDARWYGLRAADVGAAHGRFRIFVIAAPADATSRGLDGRSGCDGQQDNRGECPSGPDVDGRAGRRTEPLSLLPTPTVSDANGAGAHGDGGYEFCTLTDATVRQPDKWGDYAAAIARAEQTFAHRPAPNPTEPNARGGHRLSPRFVEWLMGLPAGHVTNTPGITRNVALKALGNGVCPPQAAAALRAYLQDEKDAA